MGYFQNGNYIPIKQQDEKALRYIIIRYFEDRDNTKRALPITVENILYSAYEFLLHTDVRSMTHDYMEHLYKNLIIELHKAL